ncbi:MAG: hypothetical protein LPK09_11245, partial [Hymenobacteraceae bacterium]|nr:hypothetical protein [Hymenobacteraceae bacterium]
YNWIYLSYMENGLVVVSSDPDLNKTIRSKASGGRGASRKYALYMGEDIDKNRFVDQFRHDYLKGKDSFKVATPGIADQGGFNFAEEEEDTKKKKKKKKSKGEEEEEWQ